MLAVVKKHHTEFIMHGQIPEKYLKMLKKDFGAAVMIQADEEELVDVTEMQWYKDEKKSETPGDVLRFYRKLNNLTQVELAQKLEITKQLVSNMENGQKPISRKMAHRLAEFFGVKAGRFI